MEKVYVVKLKEVVEEGDKKYWGRFTLRYCRTRKCVEQFIEEYIETAKEDVAREHSNTIPDNYEFVDVKFDDIYGNKEVPYYLKVTSKIEKTCYNFIHVSDVEIYDEGD